MKTRKVYRGWLVLRSNGEENDILHVAPDPFRSVDSILLAKVIANEISYFGKFLTVRYYITDQEIPEDKLTETLLNTLYGLGDAKYSMRYSEITGYLWTDERLNVGGHNLIDELKGSVGKYCHLEIEFSEKPK
jgi:hypothetical protein